MSSPKGEIVVVATISDRINKGDTELNIGGGQDSQYGLWKLANANYLTDILQYDQISGFPVFKDLICEVKKK